MTHAELVERASAWLTGSAGCGVVLTEQPHGWNVEIPDAIGWAPGSCIVVECKASPGDCRADRRKQHAANGESMGDFRWILAPAGCVKPSDLPHGHGLLEVRGSRVYVVVPAPARDVTWKRLRAECEFLRVELGEAWKKRRQDVDSILTAREPAAPGAAKGAP